MKRILNTGRRGYAHTFQFRHHDLNFGGLLVHGILPEGTVGLEVRAMKGPPKRFQLMVGRFGMPLVPTTARRRDWPDQPPWQ